MWTVGSEKLLGGVHLSLLNVRQSSVCVEASKLTNIHRPRS